MLSRRHDGLATNLKKIVCKNMVSQMTLLVNRIRKIVYRSTEKKTLVCNATIKFKLSNSVGVFVL